MNEAITVTFELPPDAILWAVGAVLYLAASVLAAVVLVRKLGHPPEPWMAGAFGLLWPGAVMTYLFIAPFSAIVFIATRLAGEPRKK